jgi:hypothetical protein
MSRVQKSVKILTGYSTMSEAEINRELRKGYQIVPELSDLKQEYTSNNKMFMIMYEETNL